MKPATGLPQRIAMAVDAGLSLPEDVLVLQPDQGADLSDVPGARVVQPFRPAFEAFQRQGFHVTPEPDGDAEAVIVCLPRAKAEAYGLVAEAAARSQGLVIVDGQKTDGADSLLKAVKKRVPLGGVVSKAHGKLFWFAGTDAFEDWATGPELTPGGFWTAPGVFSADAIDPGSALLAEAIPPLKGEVADLGSGWGFLAAHILAHPDVVRAHLVEGHHMALQCAEHNVTDPRARFYWADVRHWVAPSLMDTVVMNPPFHDGRIADPGLGQAFIEAARAMLKPKGQLLLVANRHLPYEETLAQGFRNVVDLGGDGRFKVMRAEAPRR